MKKRVLVIEDEAKVYRLLEDKLDHSFDLTRARTVAEAIGAVEEVGPFDCFVVDLSILASGLTTKEMAMYQRREGFAFLKEYLWEGKLENYQWKEDEKEKRIKELKSQTILCSRYINEFKKDFRSEVDGLQMVLKDYGYEKKVAELVKRICQ